MSAHEHDSTTDQTAAVSRVTEQPESATEDGVVAKLRREAANYRTKLRDAESERDALAKRLRTYQRSEISMNEQLASRTRTRRMRPSTLGHWSANVGSRTGMGRSAWTPKRPSWR